MKKRLLSIIALLSMLIPYNIPTVAASPREGEQVTLKLLETSDVHGNFFPTDLITGAPIKGSMARVSHIVDSVRQAHRGSVVLLDNGDILQGQPVNYYSNVVDTTRPNIAARVINYMRYDAQNWGNHDVEPGHQVFDKWTREVNCPMLGANVIDTSTGQPYLKPYTIITRQGIKVAVLGMITPAIPNWLDAHVWSGLQFQDMVSCAWQWVQYLRQHERPDVIVGLFHSGFEGGISTAAYDENAAHRVAQEVPGFDIIFFGHDHKRHSSQVLGAEGRKVILLNPANNAMTVAQATLLMQRQGNRWVIASSMGELLPVTDSPIDKAYVKHFAPTLERVSQWVRQPIGTLSKTISSQDSFFGNSDFTDLVHHLQLTITGAQISFCAPLSADAVLKKGAITVGDMFNLYKYENNLYVMRLTGREIQRYLEMSYDLWVNTMQREDDHLLLIEKAGNSYWFKNASYNFDSAMGIDYEVDVTKPKGEKVRILHMSDGTPFDPDATYRVAMNSYRASGGGQLLTKGAGIPSSELASRVVWKSDSDLRSYLMREIKRQGTISPTPGNNWRFVPADWAVPAARRDRALIFKP